MYDPCQGRHWCNRKPRFTRGAGCSRACGVYWCNRKPRFTGRAGTAGCSRACGVFGILSCRKCLLARLRYVVALQSSMYSMSHETHQAIQKAVLTEQQPQIQQGPRNGRERGHARSAGMHMKTVGNFGYHALACRT